MRNMQILISADFTYFIAFYCILLHFIANTAHIFTDCFAYSLFSLISYNSSAYLLHINAYLKHIYHIFLHIVAIYLHILASFYKYLHFFCIFFCVFYAYKCIFITCFCISSWMVLHIIMQKKQLQSIFLLIISYFRHMIAYFCMFHRTHSCSPGSWLFWLHSSKPYNNRFL